MLFPSGYAEQPAPRRRAKIGQKQDTRIHANFQHVNLKCNGSATQLSAESNFRWEILVAYVSNPSGRPLVAAVSFSTTYLTGSLGLIKDKDHSPFERGTSSSFYDRRQMEVRLSRQFGNAMPAQTILLIREQDFNRQRYTVPMYYYASCDTLVTPSECWHSVEIWRAIQ